LGLTTPQIANQVLQAFFTTKTPVAVS
jgi:hypothetical protein